MMIPMTQFKYSRTSTLILLNKVDEELWDIQPEGFPNTFRWNAGHIYSTAEDFLSEADDSYEVTLPEWDKLFLDGTRPSEWPETVPSKEDIMNELKKQEDRIEAFFKDKLNNKASSVRDVNGMKLSTIGAALQFVTWHEGIHIGVLNALSKIIK